MSRLTIRSRVATILNGTTFADTKKLRCDAYLTDQLNTPEAEINFATNHQVHMGSGGKCDQVLIVRVYDQRDDARSSQIRLDELGDPSSSISLKQKLENPDNWQGEVDYCEFLECSEMQVVEVAGLPYLSIEARFGVTA